MNALGLLVVATVALAAPAWERSDFELPGGLRVTTIHADGAARFSVMTIYEDGLLADAPGEAQFAHLVEHLIVGATDSRETFTPDFHVNGETTATAMRLETLVGPARWREALARHATWTTPPQVGEEVLERERKLILAEIGQTMASGATHKWAEAAWNQTVRHGRSHAAIYRDVERVSREDAERAVTRWLAAASGIRLVAVGPQSVAEMREAITAEFAKAEIAPRPKRKPDPAIEKRVTTPTEHRATWDLGATHYMEWYPLPNETAADRAVALLVGTFAGSRLHSSRELSALGARGVASADTVTPEGRWLTLSASLRKTDDVDAVRTIFRQILDTLLVHQRGQPAPDLTVIYTAQSIVQPPDLAAARIQWARRPGAELLEAQVALQRVHYEVSTGLSREELVVALGSVKRAADLQDAAKGLTAAARSSLLLVPAGDPGGRAGDDPGGKEDAQER